MPAMMIRWIKNDLVQDEYHLAGIKLLLGVTNKKGEQIPAQKFLLQ